MTDHPYVVEEVAAEETARLDAWDGYKSGGLELDAINSGNWAALTAT